MHTYTDMKSFMEFFFLFYLISLISHRRHTLLVIKIYRVITI